MPIVYNEITKVLIDKSKKKQNQLGISINLKSIKPTEIKINTKKYNGLNIVLDFIEKYNDGPVIAIENRIVYVLNDKSKKIEIKDNEIKIPRTIINEIIEKIANKNYILAIKLGLELGIKQPIISPKISATTINNANSNEKETNNKKSKQNNSEKVSKTKSKAKSNKETKKKK